jgi:hypothetical protein
MEAKRIYIITKKSYRIDTEKPILWDAQIVAVCPSVEKAARMIDYIKFRAEESIYTWAELGHDTYKAESSNFAHYYKVESCHLHD